MNLELNITIPLVNASVPELKAKATILLYPFFATEDDIVNNFEEIFKNISLPEVRKTLFNNSLKVYNKTLLISKLNILEEEVLYGLQREYTICLTNLELTSKLKVDMVGSTSRAKKLGDFQVSVGNVNNPAVLLKIMDDMRECISAYEDIIKNIENERVLPVAFSKASKNINTTYSNRLWWTSDFQPRLKDAFASNKLQYLDKKYKMGNYLLPEDLYVSRTRSHTGRRVI